MDGWSGCGVMVMAGRVAGCRGGRGRRGVGVGCVGMGGVCGRGGRRKEGGREGEGGRRQLTAQNIITLTSNPFFLWLGSSLSQN